MDKVLASEASDCRFDSDRARQMSETPKTRMSVTVLLSDRVSDALVKMAAERNMTVQGLAAELIDVAMADLGQFHDVRPIEDIAGDRNGDEDWDD